MRTWIFQDPKQVKKHGSKAPWSVGWYDPDGKRRGKSIGTKGQANKAAAKIQAELIEGTYNGNDRRTWAEFRREFVDNVADGKAANTRRAYIESFDHFQRLIRPVRMSAITTKTIDQYKAKRRKEKSKRRPGELISPASINKELRHLKAALRKARKWKYLRDVPDFEMEREPERIPEYATPEDFAALYEACDTMKRPNVAGLPCDPADWWRGVLVFAYMTGWRISEVLALRRTDLNLENRTAKVDADETKGKRDALVDLHPVVVEHVKPVLSFQDLVFYWPHHRRTLWSDFTKLKEAAGVSFSGAFHRLRFGFATLNRDRYDGKVLQRLMRHKSYSTTLGYINVEVEVARTADRQFVPDLPPKRSEAG